jgi:hypothetical protein
MLAAGASRGGVAALAAWRFRNASTRLSAISAYRYVTGNYQSA